MRSKKFERDLQIKQSNNSFFSFFLGKCLKKTLVFSFFCFFIFSCQKGTKRSLWMEDSGKPKVLSTIAQIGDLTAEVGGDRIDAFVLIEGALDPHSYELVKGDDEKLQRADLIFYNGLSLEHGASLSQWLQNSEKAVALGEEILSRVPNRVLEKNRVIDPHLWMDISLWSEAIEPITQKLSEIDPEGEHYYRQRATKLMEQMQETHLELIDLFREVPPEKRYLVTSHDAFHYFARSYLAQEHEVDWDKRFEAPEGLAPDGQLSPVDIQRIIRYLEKNRVEVLFPESNVSRDSIRKIASAGKELGLKIWICNEPLYGDAMDGENLSYLDMMRHNGQTIARCLQEGS